mgnify:CR=1 FL=1
MTNSGFNPINSEDYVAPLQESYKEINQGMNNYWDQEISNYNRAAEIAGKDMQALADMSSTLGEYFTKKDEERRANDRAKGYMWMQENGIDPTDQMAFKEAEAKARAEGYVINEEIHSWEQKGGDIWTSEAFRDLNASEKLGAVSAWAQMQAANYNPKKATEGAINYEEYNSALTVYRKEFYKKFGDINPAIVNEYVFKTVKATDANNYAEWYGQREQEIQTNRNEKYAGELEACVRSGNGTECLLNYQASQSIHGWDKGKSSREGFKIMKEMAKNGTLNKEMYVDMLAENRQFEHAGRKGGMADWNTEFFEDMKEISDLIDAKDLRDFEVGQSKKKMQNAEEYEDLIGSFEWGEYGLYKPQQEKLRNLKKEQERRFGFAHPKLTDDAISGLGHKENYYKEQKVKLREDILAGEVWSIEDAERLGYEMPVYGDKNIQDLLKNLNAVRFDYETQAGYVEDMVLSKAAVTNETKSSEVAQIITFLQAELKKKMIAAAIGDPDDKNIGSTQFQLLQTQFIADVENPDATQSKFRTNGLWQNPYALKENELKILQSDNITAIQRIDRLTAKGFEESVMTKDTFFSPQQLMDYGEDYNKGQFKVPLRAVYVAQKFGNKHPEGGVLTGLDVINYQREAIGLEPLERPDVLTNIEKLDDLSQDELTYNKTDSSVNRVVGATKEVAPELGNSMIHPLVQEWLNENSHQSKLKGGENMSLTGFWQQARMLENKIKETYTGDDKIHRVIESIKKETDSVYKDAIKGELKEMSNVDRQQWRRKKYLEMLYNNLGEEEVDKWVDELELDQFEMTEGANDYADMAVSMDFLAPYDFDFKNVPLENGKFSPWDQNRWTQLQYKHTGDIQYLNMLRRPAFINNE